MLKQTAELVDSQVPRASIETSPRERVKDDDNEVDDDNLKPGQTRTSEVWRTPTTECAFTVVRTQQPRDGATSECQYKFKSKLKYNEVSSQQMAFPQSHHWATILWFEPTIWFLQIQIRNKYKWEPIYKTQYICKQIFQRWPPRHKGSWAGLSTLEVDIHLSFKHFHCLSSLAWSKT